MTLGVSVATRQVDGNKIRPLREQGPTRTNPRDQYVQLDSW